MHIQPRCLHHTTPAVLLVPEPAQTAVFIKPICKAQVSVERMGVCLVQVPSAHVERLDLIPDVDKGQLSVLVHGSPAAKGLKVTSPLLSTSNTARCECARCSSA